MSPPATPNLRELLDEANNLLAGQQFGIFHADVLKSVAGGSWILQQFPDKDSLELTRLLVGLHPRLAQEYETLVSSEGFFTWAMSSIPVFGRPLASAEFLEANKGINRIMQDLEHGGLVQVSHFIQVMNGGLSPLGSPVSVSRLSFTISLTEVGKLSLEAHE